MNIKICEMRVENFLIVKKLLITGIIFILYEIINLFCV